MTLQADSFVNQRGYKIHTTTWTPQTTPKAVVMLIHGIREHAQRYAVVGSLLADNGYLVCGHDHQGHGQSEGLRGYFETFTDPVDDLEQYFQLLQQQWPDTPIIVYGHSMGSLVSTLFVLRRQEALAGWISSGSPLYTRDLATIDAVYQFGRMLSRVMPKMYFLPFKAGQGSHDPAVAKSMKSDPLFYKQPLRLSLMYQIMENGINVRSQIQEINLPVLLMHGADDPLTPLAGSQFLYDHMASTDKTLKIYDGMYHEVHNEIGKEQVFADVVDWLDAHCPTTP